MGRKQEPDAEAEGGMMDVPTGMRSEKFKNYCSETFRCEVRCLDWMARQIEPGLFDVTHQANFSREDTHTLVVFCDLWTQNLVQRTWISIKALLSALRGKIQQKVEASAIEEGMLLAVGFVGCLLDASANQNRRRAPSEAVTRTTIFIYPSCFCVSGVVVHCPRCPLKKNGSLRSTWCCMSFT